MTPKGLRKCRAVDGEENQKQVSRRRPRALGNRCRDSHIPAAPATTAMGKWKSKNRIPTFPQRLPCHHQKNQKRKEINPSPKPCPSGSSQDWNMLTHPDGNLIVLEKALNSSCNNRTVQDKLNSSNLYAESAFECVQQFRQDCNANRVPSP